MSKQGFEVSPSAKVKPPIAGPRRTRVVVRKVGPLSVLRWSLFFYFCLFLIGYVAMVIIWQVLDAAGVIHTIGKLIGSVDPTSCPTPVSSTTTCVVQIHSGWIFSRAFVIGVVIVCVWSVINVLISLLYNLVADVIGGIEMTLVEKR